MGPGVTDLAVNPDSRQVLVSGGAPNQLTTIDVGPHRLGPRYSIPTDAQATGVAADTDALYLTTPSEDHLWVLDRAGVVKRSITVAGAASVLTVPQPFTIRVIPKELPNTGAGPFDGSSLYLWAALLTWAAVAVIIGLTVRRKRRTGPLP